VTQNKVRLPRAVAEAIEKLRTAGHVDHYILWKSCRDDNESYSEPWKVLRTFTAYDSYAAFRLADALRYGYIVEEPITVTITPEQQDWIRKHYRNMTLGQQEAIQLILSDVLGIKIPEVND